jgi:hypothetical protein
MRDITKGIVGTYGLIAMISLRGLVSVFKFPSVSMIGIILNESP